MSENSGDLSDGSDIDVEEEIDFSNVIEEEARNQWNNPENDEYMRFLDDDSSDEEFEGFDGNWRRENFSARVRRPYTEVGGPVFQHPEEAGPLHYFDLLWGQDLWELLVQETNRYAQQERERNPPPTFAPRWRPVDVPTMKAFLGLIFVMGIMRLPHRNDYWRTGKRMFTTSFGKIMPRDRFNLIWRYLHLYDNTRPGENPDKLRKVRPLIAYLNRSFERNYTPYGDMTVDESMVKFKGRLSFRQYLPAKPVKWGMKIWTLAESSTGYLHKFQVYTGRDNDAAQERGLSNRVVTDLLGHLQFKNIRVYMDNFYTSVDLLKSLLARGIYACGTIRSNRKGLPTELLPKNLRQEKHQYSVAQLDDLTFCNWQDTKPVLVLSNFHDPEAVGYVNRRSGNPEQRQVRVPKSVEDYQRHMKGVDLYDQMLGYYILNHRSRKWWRRLFHHLQMSAAYNAFVIAKDTHPEKVQREWPQFQDFLEDLADGLIGDTSSARDQPLQAIPVPGNRHVINPNLFAKRKSCKDCRKRAGVGERTTQTLQGCSVCQVAVCKKCVGFHIQGV